MGETFGGLREHNRGIREKQREKRTKAIEGLSVAGYKVRKLTEYQYRINDRLDIYPTWAKWHDIKTGARGEFKGKRVIEFVDEFFDEIKSEADSKF